MTATMLIAPKDGKLGGSACFVQADAPHREVHVRDGARLRFSHIPEGIRLSHSLPATIIGTLNRVNGRDLVILDAQHYFSLDVLTDNARAELLD